jgi:hypothetical protein
MENVTRCAGMVLLWLAIATCGPAPTPTAKTAAPATPARPAAGFLGNLGTPSCMPSASFHGWNAPGSFPEVGLDSKQGSVWALFFVPVPPPAHVEIKVVWRMTGTGAFSFRASDGAGKVAPLAWGPVGHGSSDWNHPGDEVGTGFNFAHAGCWDIHVARSDSSADLWLEVVA